MDPHREEEEGPGTLIVEDNSYQQVLFVVEHVQRILEVVVLVETLLHNLSILILQKEHSLLQ